MKSPPSELFSDSWSVSQFISGECQPNPVDGDHNMALSGATERRHKRATHAERTKAWRANVQRLKVMIFPASS